MTQDPNRPGPDAGPNAGAHGGGMMQDARDSFNALIFLAQCLALTMLAWFRRPGSCGTHFFNWQAGVGTLLMLGTLVFFPAQPAGPLFAFWGLTCLALAIHRAAHLFAPEDAPPIHSRDVGESHLTRLGLSNGFAARSVEPLLTAVAGGFTCLWCPPLGAYLVAAGLAMGLAAGWQQDAERARLRAMRDAAIEAEVYAQRFRSGGR